MKQLRVFVVALAGVLAAGGFGCRSGGSSATGEVLQVSGELRQDPPMAMYVAVVDLSQPGVSARVVRGGPDPDGAGPWEATLQTVPDVAEREGFELAVNGDFFAVPEEVDPATGKRRGYYAGMRSSAIGSAMTDGEQWSKPDQPRPTLVFDDQGRARLVEAAELPADARQAVAGNVFLVRDGQVVPQKNKDKHPRTVVGLDRTGRKLILLVVDGRREGYSVGMTYEELGQEMVRLGAYEAINLDGGGSSTMVMRDSKGGGYRIVNRLSGSMARPVVNVLGVDLPEAKVPTTVPVRRAG